MSGSVTYGGGENFPCIPGACATRNFTYLARGPWWDRSFASHYIIKISNFEWIELSRYRIQVNFNTSIHEVLLKLHAFDTKMRFIRYMENWRNFPLMNSPHKAQWCGALIFLWSAPWIHCWVNNRGTGDLKHYRTHYGDIVMKRFLQHNSEYIHSYSAVQIHLYTTGQA